MNLQLCCKRNEAQIVTLAINYEKQNSFLHFIFCSPYWRISIHAWQGNPWIWRGKTAGLKLCTTIQLCQSGRKAGYGKRCAGKGVRGRILFYHLRGSLPENE